MICHHWNVLMHDRVLFDLKLCECFLIVFFLPRIYLYKLYLKFILMLSIIFNKILDLNSLLNWDFTWNFKGEWRCSLDNFRFHWFNHQFNILEKVSSKFNTYSQDMKLSAATVIKGSNKRWLNMLIKWKCQRSQNF